MKYYLLLLLFLAIYCGLTTANSTELSENSPNLIEIARTGFGKLWNWIQEQGKTEDTFVGRCLGIGKKLRMLMPLFVFKMGVIVTTLGFLTIFSLKSLGLLVALLVMNSSGFVAKLISLKHHSKESHQPQNVHFHVHQSKDGQYYVDHSESEHGWSDRISDTYGSSIAERLQRLNIYDKR